jgi:hypothetical protein
MLDAFTDYPIKCYDDEELQKPNNLGDSLKECWDSDACNELQKSNE